jgi:hypothetical protein
VPRSPHHVKIRRKDLRRPDEFKTVTTHAAEWIVAHRSLAMTVGVAVLVVAIVALLVGRYSASRDEAAAVAFRNAHETFQAGKFAEAAASFGALADEYGSTPFGPFATLYRAHALARQGDFANAIAAYQTFLGSRRAVGYVRQEALVGLAHVQEASGDPGARDSFTQSAALDGPYRTQALLSAARLAEAAGHGDEARALYARLEKEAPDPEALELARAKLAGQPTPEAQPQP